MLIYGELATRWYRLLDPVEDHADEAACYEAALLRGVSGPAETLLELGAGAGNNASYLRRRFRCTLADRSPAMLDLSRGLNADCEHVLGDMRSLRLGRSFDAVFVHDAVMYITTEEDLRAVAETAYVHTRPGGAALFAPDCVKETFREHTDLTSGEDGGRAMRCVEWAWDPDPGDSTFVTDYVFALREEGRTTVHHDQHLEGLFSRETWLRLLSGVGFLPEVAECVLDGQACETFLCRRPYGP
jgi:trans-aconitate methyltransferase